MIQKKERVQKLISNFGYCSRRKAEELIQQGRVSINSKITKIGDKASQDASIFIDGNRINKAKKKIYLKFHKPIKCVTSLSDPNLKTIMEYIDLKERVFPVGRLDFMTSGLLLLTNDGDFANKIMHPSNEIKKAYVVKSEKPVIDKDLDRIRSGVKLEDFTTKPAKVKRLKSNMVEVTIHEGKNRIIRRIFEKLGYSVASLHRVKIGDWELGDLKTGKYEYLEISN